MSTNFSVNLKSLIKRRGLTQRSLASALNVTEATVSNWTRGIVNAPREMKIREQLCAALDASPAELFGYSDGYASRSLGYPLTGSPEKAFLPYLGFAHAGEFADPLTIDDNVVEVPKSVADRHPNGRVITIDGDCVNRVIPSGSIAVVDPDVEPQNGSLVCASIDSGDFILRRMFRGGRKLMLSPDSFIEEYDDIIFDENDERDLNLIGTVVWHQAAKEME